MYKARRTALAYWAGLLACVAGSGAGGLEGKDKPEEQPLAVVQADPPATEAAKTEGLSAAPGDESDAAQAVVNQAARAAAAAALASAQVPASRPPAAGTAGKFTGALPTDGRPGDVRLTVTVTDLPVRKRWVVPPLPLPPFRQWGRWLDENRHAAHCSLDWMDDQGQWWHTEMRGYDHHPAQYRVGEGEFQCSGLTVYGVFILPGRTDPEGCEVLLDEKIQCDYRAIEAEARAYGRKDRRSGEPGTGGNGSRNVGLGGPAFKPSQNSNTFISHLLRRAGARRDAPPYAIGWDTVPHFPYSSDAPDGAGRTDWTDRTDRTGRTDRSDRSSDRPRASDPARAR